LKGKLGKPRQARGQVVREIRKPAEILPKAFGPRKRPEKVSKGKAQEKGGSQLTTVRIDCKEKGDFVELGSLGET